MNKKSQNGAGWAKNIAYTLNGRDVHGVVYDARGNGGGGIAPTITGDHQDRITDYTAIVVVEDERKTLFPGNRLRLVEREPNSANDTD